jgi:NAD(P)-dependent dehydrogenase (short-subunit alcohol dehydrogenase family)
MHALNFETAYYIARAVFNQMMKQSGGGRIIFIGARPAMEPNAGKTAIAYGLSKSLLFKLSEYLNVIGAEKNIVTYVAVPSTIDTPPNRQAMPKADFSTWQKPEDIAGVLAKLARTESVHEERVVRLYEKK